MAVDWKGKGVVFGSQAIAKGIERVAVEVDKYATPLAVTPHTRASTWINLGGGLAIMVVPNMTRMAAGTQEVTEIIGGHMLNKVWDYLEEYMAAPAPPAAAARAAARRAAAARAGGRYAVETPGGAPEFYPPLYGQRTGREPVLRDHVRYTLEP